MSGNKTIQVDRSNIRRAFVEAIKTANTVAGNTVVNNATKATWIEKLPAVSVNTISESAKIFEQSPPRWKRTLDLQVECKVAVKGSDEEKLSDAIDYLMHQCEQALGYAWSFNDKFSCLMNEMEITSITVEFEDGGQNLVAGGSILYQIEYYQDFTSKQAKLVDLDLVHVDYKQGDNVDTEINSDEFSVPTI